MIVPAAKIYFPEVERKDLQTKFDEILKSGQLTLGKYTKEFETRFAEYVGTKYAVAVNSGTSSLEIILRSLDIASQTVIVPTNTFFATPASVIHAGGKVQFGDISDDFSLDPTSLQEQITKDTKAVIIVHIGGIVSPKIKEIQQICSDNNLLLIEDAAHAHGSSLGNKMAGSFGTAASFSFYPTKVMTSGEGGMITTDDKKINERALVFRDQGKSGFFGNVHVEMGYNWRMSELHAAVGLSQFKCLDDFIHQRRRIAKIYDKKLIGIKYLELLNISPSVKSNYYKYIALLDKTINRTEFKKKLKEKYEISLSGEVYELPCHLQPVIKDLYGFKGGEYPIAEDICNRHICLPVFPEMTNEQADFVVNSIKEVLQ